MTGRRVNAGGLSPWAVRDAAMRGLGQARRRVAEAAVKGQLPTPSEVRDYQDAELRFAIAHDRWLRSRKAAEAAADARP